MESNSGALSLFQTSVETCVAKSVQERVPLVVLVLDQSQHSQTWMADLLSTDELADVLRDRSVALRLENGSTEAQFFAQIFPIAHVPALYIIDNGSMVDYITGSVEYGAFLDRIRTAIQRTSPSSETAPTSTASVLIESSPEMRSEAPVSASTPNLTAAGNVEASSSTILPPPPTGQQLNERRDRIHSQIKTEKNTKKQSDQPHPINYIETGPTHNKHQEELRRKRIQDSEERQRILKLVHGDREEQKAKSKPATSSPAPGSETHKRAFSLDIHRHADSAIAIRLFDGSSIKNRFPLEATLGDVRTWIDSARTDGDAPYSILSLFPHQIFSPSDELETLVDLNLHPTATLILKPISNYSSAYSPTSAIGRVQSSLYNGISWAWGAVGSYIGAGYSDSDCSECGAEGSNRNFSVSQSPRTLQNMENEEQDRRTYNGNQLSLEDDSN
ncbi:hypothetical protein V1512DRAFT_243871 [Lipomyces arxii]|uniref:uncharacterized protein n=1 Tax=Lipomyces arxii TaxID=56418 RepID=UPI0034CED0F4